MRTQSRILAFEIIFADLFENSNLKLEDLACEEKVKEFAKQIISAYLENKPALQEIVKKSTEKYEIDRIFKVDLALIYLGAVEILYIKTPKAVVINEVLEIAKKYSTEKSKAFINGILAKID